MINIKCNDRVSIFGRTGSGKTYFIIYFLLKYLKRQYRTVFFDIKDEVKGQIDYDIKINNISELDNYFITNQKKDLILFIPKTTDVDEFNDFCKIIYKQGDIIVIIDEVSYYATQFKIESWHRELIVRGRSRNIGLGQVSQRPRGISNYIISETNHFILYQLVLKNDIDKLSTMIPMDILNQVYTLTDYKYLYYNIYGNFLINDAIIK